MASLQVGKSIMGSERTSLCAAVSRQGSSCRKLGACLSSWKAGSRRFKCSRVLSKSWIELSYRTTMDLPINRDAKMKVIIAMGLKLYRVLTQLGTDQGSAGDANPSCERLAAARKEAHEKQSGLLTMGLFSIETSFGLGPLFCCLDFCTHRFMWCWLKGGGIEGIQAISK
ncbi:uncharacterized protein MYCFIDRAFT_175097 [Pseudocercospora fijiensis CIRAD86]|uniref:Uncharacterized protein n=1 Tax=Pseudocercospora fijiensis (strain CIRAD86) TaxID=383855 RepID=M2Z1G5_PSEFD|nr:uncharacterized protein MYCFIDRAFT_175097 [Pseudocercospora fijiensis CIRAD86]EME83670.1 hypothetical protein MYCFIDRAFT_175097 [Pseudocercospora fijiensis CIRAD86]